MNQRTSCGLTTPHLRLVTGPTGFGRYHSASQRDVYQSTVIARLGDDGDVTKELFMWSVKRNQQFLSDLFMWSVNGAKSFCLFFVLFFFVSMVQIV